VNLTVLTYVVYLLLSVILTVWVARTLSRTGHVFLVALLRGDEAVAGAVNRLLAVGFYLLDLGFVTLFMRIGGTVSSTRACFEALSVKIGTVLLVLGVFHLLNVYLLARIRRRSVRVLTRGGM
jgi:hypothetical protein